MRTGKRCPGFFQISFQNVHLLPGSLLLRLHSSRPVSSQIAITHMIDSGQLVA